MNNINNLNVCCTRARKRNNFGIAHVISQRALRILLILLSFVAFMSVAAFAQPQKVMIGIQISPAMTLVMVAKDRGFFQQEGLNVELKPFTAGKFALQAFLSHAIDYAVAGEVPACLAALQGNDFRVVTQVVEKTTNEVRVVAIRDTTSNVQAYFNSHRRKLATSFGGGPEFFTYNFLKKNRIDPKNIELISQKPEDMPAALETKSVDAISIFDPFAFIAGKRMGQRAITFKDPTSYSELYVLTAHPEQIAQAPKTIEAILRALQKASDFTLKHPEEAKNVLQHYSKLDRGIIDGVWSNFTFKLALNKRLTQYWIAEALWAKETHKISPSAPPLNIKSLIEPRFLRKVSPSSVKL